MPGTVESERCASTEAMLLRLKRFWKVTMSLSWVRVAASWDDRRVLVALGGEGGWRGL
jgi:hypothetical protein